MVSSASSKHEYITTKFSFRNKTEKTETNHCPWLLFAAEIAMSGRLHRPVSVGVGARKTEIVGEIISKP